MSSAAAPPTDTRPEIAVRPRSGWRRTASLWLGVLATYWVVLFASTHTPDVTVAGSVLDFDKLVHAGAYGVLVTLILVVWRRTGGSPGWRGRLAVGAVALGYGAFDELTQPLAGRQCELADWLADALGAAAAAVVDQWRHGRR